MMKKTEATDMQHFKHAHIYYVVMVIAMVLGLLCFVQAVIYQTQDEVNFALALYTIAVLLAIVAKSSHTRGMGHYHYHAHLR
jgi:hypothetical protein